MEMEHLEKELEKSVGEIIIDLQREIRELEEENKNLNEKVRFLEQCLDNKEKVNKSLREENEKLRIDREFEKGNTIFGM